jgi:hypothetical protein
MQVGDQPTEDRLRAALQSVREGRAVDFGGFSLSVADGALRIDVEYQECAADDARAHELLQQVESRVEQVLQDNHEWRNALHALKRRFALVRSDGMGDVEVAHWDSSGIHWLF